MDSAVQWGMNDRYIIAFLSSQVLASLWPHLHYDRCHNYYVGR